MDGLTQRLGAFVSGLEFGALPGAAVETVKRGAIDCLAALFAGRDEPLIATLRAASCPGAAHEAQLLFDRGRAAAPDAALVNAAAAHALDYDDTALDGHPSVVLVPVVLAEGERAGAGGARMIAAYVAGYETWAELVGRDADKHHGKGWHPTAVFGTLAAAAAGANLRRLDAGRTAAALGIAASMAGGLVANFGSMTKPFQVGRAAQNGLLAARLAEAGMSASPDALEHSGGLLQALSPRGRVRIDGALSAGRDWHILRHGLNVKRYPVCYALHRSIDALLGLAAEQRLAPGEVQEIEVRIGRLQAGMLRHSRPQTALDAKFSAQFAMACALVAGRVGLEELDDAFVRSTAIQSLLPKVRVAVVEGADPDEPLFAPQDSVAVKLADGAVLESEPVRHARGHARNPIGLDELRAKFETCVGGALAPARRERLFEALLRLEALPAAAELYRP